MPPTKRLRLAIRKMVLIPSLLVLSIGIYSVYSVQTASRQVRLLSTFVGGVFVIFAAYGVATSFVRVKNRAQEE